jgi:hypothetical protein
LSWFRVVVANVIELQIFFLSQRTAPELRVSPITLKQLVSQRFGHFTPTHLTEYIHKKNNPNKHNVNSSRTSEIQKPGKSLSVDGRMSRSSSREKKNNNHKSQQSKKIVGAIKVSYYFVQ